MKQILQNDNELMKMVQSGDSGKLGVLYERHKKDLFYYFYRMTDSVNKSEDLVQNTFMKVMRYSGNFTGQGQFAYWLYSIARNVWIDAAKKRDVLKQASGVEALYGHESSTESGHRQLEKKERKELLHMALSQLTPEKKEAIVLSRFQGLKYSEIATMTNTSETAIKSRIKRGLEEVKQIFEKLEAQ